MNAYIRIQNNEVTNTYPAGLPASVPWCDDRPYYNATHRHAADGIYPAQFAITPDGMVKTGSTWALVDGVCIEAGEYVTQEECDSQERADRIATITPKLWNMAAIFVATLRQHFGAGAETNHEVTAATVEQYFIGKRLAGTLTMLDLADASLLERGFEMITAWTGDGTIWSFPWEVLQ